jgi:hypothetical protein
VLCCAALAAGLYLVKHDSAVLSTLTNALVLPLTCLAFTLPVLGRHREPFDAVTLFGLCIVLCGFAIWRVSSLTWEAAPPPLTNDNLLLLSERDDQSCSCPDPFLSKSQQQQQQDEDEEEGVALTSGLSCYGYTPRENRHRSRSNSFDSTFSAPDAFYDRVIVLSLNNAAAD